MLDRLKTFLRAPEKKSSRTAALIQIEGAGQARWTPRDYGALAREGFARNAVVHRCVKLVAENVAAVSYLAYEGASLHDTHPLLDLLARPNPRQSGASLLEAVAANLMIAGNAYVEAVSLDGRVRELYTLRPDRMRLVPGPNGWAVAYEYVVAGQAMRFDQSAEPTPPILHLALFNPLDDHYGLGALEAAAIAIDAFVQLAVESRGVAAPPGSPAEGDCYIVAVGGSGAWSGWDQALAVFSAGAWLRLTPPTGCKAWVKDERLAVIFADARWADGVALTQSGGRITLRAKETEVTLTGSFVETADASFIPDRAVVIGVASRTTMAITGASSYNVGIAGDTSKFGGTLSIALGGTNIGVIGPTAFYAGTKARVSANGGAFTAGKVRLVVYFIEMTAPSA